MEKQFGLPLYVIWLISGLTFIGAGILAAFAWTFGIAAFTISGIIGYLGYRLFIKPAFVERNILKDGIPAMAIILDMWDTGITVDHNPRVGMLLEVRHQNRIPYEVEVKHNVRKDKMNYYQAGRTLNVKIDSSDPRRVAILPK